MVDGVSRRGFLAGAATTCAAAVRPGPAAGQSRNGGEAADGPRSDPTDTDADLRAFVTDTVESALDEYDATGAAVAVVRDGSVALTEGFGHAILDEDEPIDPDESLFQLGSTVKAVTWTAAMQQVDRGRVDPHADVREYLTSVEIPEADEPAAVGSSEADGSASVGSSGANEPVTLAHLATHTAGFGARIVGDTVSDLAHRRPLPETLADEQPPIVRPPGELPGYTNYAAGLAGQLVADVASDGDGPDVTYAEYVDREIFEPLGMERSTFDPAPDGLGGGPGECYFDEAEWYSDIAPASGMSATAADMAQFVLAHLNGGAGEHGRILSPEATASMHEQWYAVRDGLDGMAFGFSEDTRGGTRVLAHSGQVPGFGTDLLLVPELDLGVFVSFQGEAPGGAAGKFREAFLDEFVPTEDAELTPDGRPSRADDLVGTYRNVHGTDGETYNKLPMAAYFGSVEVSIAADGALVTDHGGGPERWVEVEPLVFRRVDGAESLAFVERGDGVTHLVFGGSVVAFERIDRYEELGFQARLAAVATAIAATGLAGWPLAAGWRRLRGQSGLSANARRARWVAGGAAAALLALPIALLAVAIGVDALGGPSLDAYPPPGFRLLFWLPVASGVATVGAAAFALRAWLYREWGLPARLHYTAVVAATSVLVWLCHYWRLAV